ncbi:MAG: sigma-70 family RNA polymerase sigma factor [Cyclobacteriaceae bacterium]
MRNRNLFTEKSIFMHLQRTQQVNGKAGQYLLQLVKQAVSIKLNKHRNACEHHEDLVMDTLEILIGKCQSGRFVFDEQKGFLPFVYITIHNLIQQKLRYDQRLQSDDCLQRFALPEEVSFLSEEELISLMERVLPPAGVNIIRLAIIERYSNEEIAELLGYNNAATVANLKYRHLRLLRERLNYCDMLA